MQLVIRFENGQTINHPIAFENFLSLYPDANYDDLPSGFKKFIRVPRPIVGPFERISSSPSYVLEGGIVRDVWEITSFSEQEKRQKIEEVRSLKPFDSWSFIEEELRFEPPAPYPTDGKLYRWNEQLLSWEEVGLAGE